jgi:hypothetical protein
VLAANDPGLATIALRPRLIWGPGDQQLLPRLVERARAGRLRIVGQWRQPDRHHVYRQCRAGAPGCVRPSAARAACAGRAYFISNGEPRPAREIINALLQAAGAPPIDKTLPFALAYAIGATCEAAWTLLPLRGEPPLTRFLAEQLATTHWYDMAPATRDFRLRAAGDDRRRLSASASRVAGISGAPVRELAASRGLRSGCFRPPVECRDDSALPLEATRRPHAGSALNRALALDRRRATDCARIHGQRIVLQIEQPPLAMQVRVEGRTPRGRAGGRGQ